DRVLVKSLKSYSPSFNFIFGNISTPCSKGKLLLLIARLIRIFFCVEIKITEFALSALNVDKNGLDEMDNKILTTIIDKFKGGPVGITTLATAVSENGETIEEVYEPFLIQQGFIIRTPRGRQVTELAYKHLGREKGGIQGGLF
ncbi:MAG: hypothetical protein HRT68_12615, partial [Flavobacteriaceae bacterium]|nr:hypothetical protein [Flavobacteriaceae bacterium]